MKAGDIYSKTMPFVWAKLLLGLINIIAAVVLLAVFMGIAMLTNGGSIVIILFIVWLGSVKILNFIINHYFGYLVKAGHVAVIVEAANTGQIPENQVAYGKQQVTARFATSNIYFAVDKLVSGAVKQIQNGIEKAGNLLDFIPGMQFATSIAKLFISIFLGYVDECCLGYTFLKPNQPATKSAADGVVIYAQNWKILIKNAAKTMAIVIALLIVVFLVSFIPLLALFQALHWNAIFAFAIAVFMSAAIKSAFIDSYILVNMMVSYMAVVPTTEITFDLYGKLCSLSAKFKQLFDKGQKEAESQQPPYAQVPVSNTSTGSIVGWSE